MSRWRTRIYGALDGPSPHDPASRFIAFALLTLILLNVIAMVLESVPAIHAAWGPSLAAFQHFSIAVFVVEYAVRLWCAPERPDGRFSHPLWGRLRYAVTPMAIVDLVAILPTILAFLGVADLRVLRLARLLKLTRYSRSLNLLTQVLREEARPVAAALMILLMLLVLAASLAYLAEHEAQPEAFGSIPAAMWWAIISMTTVGYGDITPVTLAGKLIASCIGIIGVGMVALPAGLLASGFTHKLHRQTRRFEALVDSILQDGRITETEKHRLSEARQALDLDDKEAAEIFESRARAHGFAPGHDTADDPEPVETGLKKKEGLIGH